MNHVVASLGDRRVVSQQSLFAGVKGSVADVIAALNPTIDTSALFAKGLTHISTIDLIARSGGDTPTIKALDAPFWTLARVPWVG
jgi:hypothetical protein